MTGNLPDILKVSVDRILQTQGVSASGETFTGGLTPDVPLRPTQAEALTAYSGFLGRNDLSADQKKHGYFEIPTGIGKTGLFVSVVREAHKEIAQLGKAMRSVVIVPTTELLTQTRDEFLQYAPALENDIGLYGGLDRELGKPVTIITYDSWSQLTERGELSSANVDLLISDEAHRGTSERRAEHFFSAYGNGTVHIAFTATAHFDEEKSVQGTHQNEIFYKSLPETVKGGEQAAYIHSQLYVIRIAPEDKQQKSEAVPQAEEVQDTGPDMRRQAAWNQRTAHIYAHGRDRITDEPLSDNQAAFFTSSVAQANALETQLNADPILAAKAKEKGCIGVCAAIHSYMSPHQQRQRFIDFKAGRYMAIAGDGKFKEGFDHRPLKVIFDSQRGSIVDKVQIMGRAARQWWNEPMQRHEGMTFVDTVVYHGSDDPKYDKINRARALRNSILASNVLEGTEIFSRHYVRPDTAGKNSGEVRLFGEFDGVEEYATLEDIHTIHAEIGVLKGANTIEFTEEMRSNLHALFKKKGIGSKTVYRMLDEDIARSMKPMTISSWIHSNYRRVPTDQWEAVMAVTQTVPDLGVRMVVTDQDLDWLKKAMTDKYVGARRLHQIMEERGEWPEGLTENRINAWFMRALRSAEAAQWDAVKRTLNSLPVVELKTLTQKEKDDFAREIVEKNFGEVKLMNALGDDVPEGLSHQMIRGWYRGKVTVVRADHWNAVRPILSEIEEVRTLTQKDKDWLRQQFGARLIEVPEIAKILTDKGMPTKAGNLTRLFTEKAKTVSAPLWTELVRILAASDIRYKVTDADQLWLRAQTTRAGLTTGTMIAAMQSQGIEPPAGFNPVMVESWRSGNKTRISLTHWQAVKSTLENAPDAEARYIITEKDRLWLETELAKKMTPADIIRALGDKPGTVTFGLIHHWQKGTTTSAVAKDWKAVKAILEKAPEKTARHTITEAERLWLSRQITTKLAPAEIVRRLGNKAENINPAVICSWARGDTSGTTETGWQAVKGILDAIEDIKFRIITKADRVWLTQQMQTKDMSAMDLAIAAQRKPTKRLIEGWLKGDVTEAEEADWELVVAALKVYDRLPKTHAAMLRQIKKDTPDVGAAFERAGQKLPQILNDEQALGRVVGGWMKALPADDIKVIEQVYTQLYPQGQSFTG